jgi:Calx-beta domain
VGKRTTRAVIVAVGMVTVIAGTALPARAKPRDVTPHARFGDTIVVRSQGGATTALLPIVLVEPATTPMTVSYATYSSSEDTDEALAEVDYTATAGSVTFAPGEVQHDVRIRIHRGKLATDHQDFHVEKTGSSGGVVDENSGLVRIVPPTPTQMLRGTYALFDAEHPGKGKGYTATIAFVLTKPLKTAVTGTYSELSTTETPGVDYVAKTGALTIPAGALSASVKIRLLRPEPRAQSHHIEVRFRVLSGLSDQPIASGFIETT